jgi:hypothetical protein
MNMPSEFKAAIEAAHGDPVEIVDGDRHYVLIDAEVYQKMADLVDQEDVKSMYQYIGRVFGPDGWDDPAMDIYNDLDPRKQP